MAITATPKTALITGIWTAIGMPVVDTWLKHMASTPEIQNLIFFGAAVVFLFLPATLFVAGPQFFRFGYRDMLGKSFWLGFRAVGFRALCWFAGAIIGLCLFAVAEKFLIV